MSRTKINRWKMIFYSLTAGVCLLTVSQGQAVSIQELESKLDNISIELQEIKGEESPEEDEE